MRHLRGCVERVLCQSQRADRPAQLPCVLVLVQIDKSKAKPNKLLLDEAYASWHTAKSPSTCEQGSSLDQNV